MSAKNLNQIETGETTDPAVELLAVVASSPGRMHATAVTGRE